MHKTFWTILFFSIIFIAIIALFFLFGQKKQQTSDIPSDTRPVLAATIFPLYDIVRNVAGDDAVVHLLLPPGASPHFYEFTPRQLDALQDTNMSFVIGHGIDDWASDTFAALDIQAVTVDQNITLRPADKDHGHEEPSDDHEHEESADEHHEHEESADEHHEHGEIDPHYWLDPRNAMTITQTVTDTLIVIDPTHADNYRENAAHYIQELEEMDRELQGRLTTLPHKEIITIHDAWNYFADHFGLTIAATFMPQAGDEPSPQYLGALGHAAQESSQGVIFSEPQLATSSLSAFASDHDLQIAILDPIGGVEGRDTYKDLIVYNVNTIINALTQ